MRIKGWRKGGAVRARRAAIKRHAKAHGCAPTAKALKRAGARADAVWLAKQGLCKAPAADKGGGANGLINSVRIVEDKP